jgi:drug efflux transport system permease protein
MNLGRLLAMARKEAVQIRRDTRSMILAFVLPMMLILFFGYAITFDVKNIELAVLDRDVSPESRRLLDSFESSGYFRLVAYLQRDDEVRTTLDRGRARLVLLIPPTFASDLATSRLATVQLILDGGDANTATIARGYAEAIVSRFGLQQSAAQTTPPAVVRADSRVWYNETLESVNMIVPGLIAVIMSIIAAMLTALTIAREWERGTMEQLAATPVSRLEVVLGKLIPYVVIGMVDVFLAILAGIIIFHVPLRGNILLLGVMSLLFLTGALGFGMFLSAALKSQVLATQAAMITTYLPALLLSGFLYSIANMPIVLRIITYIIPARYFIAVTRGIFLKGIGPGVLWADGVAMVAFATVGLTLATRAFKKEIA